MREEQLYYINEIAQTGSINKAADNLFMSHQSLSRSLSSVENELGVVIFCRSKNGVTTTESGALVLDKIQELINVFAELHALSQRAQETPESYAETFSLYASFYLRYPLVNTVIGEMIHRFPRIRYVTQVYSEGVTPIQEDAYYLLHTWEQNILEEENTKWVTHKFYEDQTHLLVGLNHPLAKYREVSIDRALQYPFAMVSFANVRDNPLYEWCRLQNRSLNLGLSTDHLQTYMDAIKNGHLIGIWPEISLHTQVLEGYGKSVRAIPIRGLPPLIVYGRISKKGYERNQVLVQALISIILQNIRI